MHLIVAVNQKNVIGKNNSIPWHISEDLKNFKEVTNNHIIVMGRKTYESLPQKPLPNRINVVITSQPENYENSENIIFTNIESSFDKIFEINRNNGNKKKIFIIGGTNIYQHFLPYCTRMHVTKIFNDCDGDSFFPYDLETYTKKNNFQEILCSEVKMEKNIKYQLFVYEKKSGL